jgi:hypothetical protein
MTDGNELSYSTSDPSGGSTEPPGRPGTTAIALPAVAMPVLGRPLTTQALRRPPAPNRSQSSGSHRRSADSRERSRDRGRVDPLFGRELRLYRPRTPTGENSPTSSNASSRRKREEKAQERERRRVRRNRADEERRERSISSSEPDREHSQNRAAFPEGVPIGRVSSRPTPAGSVGTDQVAVSDVGEGILIDTPNAPSLAGPSLPGPWDPNIRVTRDEQAAIWMRANIDMTDAVPFRPDPPGLLGTSTAHT